MINGFNFDFDGFLKVLMTGALAYIIFTLRRFVSSIDNLETKVSTVLRTIVAIIAEHGINHPDTKIDLSEIMKSMQDKL